MANIPLELPYVPEAAISSSSSLTNSGEVSCAASSAAATADPVKSNTSLTARPNLVLSHQEPENVPSSNAGRQANRAQRRDKKSSSRVAVPSRRRAMEPPKRLQNAGGLGEFTGQWIPRNWSWDDINYFERKINFAFKENQNRRGKKWTPFEIRCFIIGVVRHGNARKNPWASIRYDSPVLGARRIDAVKDKFQLVVKKGIFGCDNKYKRYAILPYYFNEWKYFGDGS